MNIRSWAMATLLCCSLPAPAEEPVQQDDAAQPKAAHTSEGDGGDGQAKTMSGMSILGNEEAPKALVIVPWKSSRMGADLSLSDSLDDLARPVDREVFMRELGYYKLRSEN